MRTVETPAECSGLAARDLLPPDVLHALSSNFPSRKVEYIAHVLTVQELRVVGDWRDAAIIARIKRMPARRLERFERYVPSDKEQQRFYQAVQAKWLRDEEYLLGTRLGRRPTMRELFIDFMNNHHGLRFRAYFALKYPGRMHIRAKQTKAAPLKLMAAHA